MAKTDFDYFKRKYQTDAELQRMLKDKDYRNIAENIFGDNIEKMTRKTGVRSEENWKEEFQKPQFKERKYVIPKFQEVAPTKNEIKSRARVSVQGISNTLRIGLTENLREKINSFKSRFKEQTYIKRRINPSLESEMQREIKETFENYTKKDPAFGVPKNIRAIAVTELRTAVSNIKSRVAHAIESMNPTLKLKKRWIHNPHLSKDPRNIRIGHAKINGTRKLLQEYFDVPLYKVIVGIPIHIQTDKMMQPHDLNAPASQVINCHCDVEYSP
jgi:hypothetical protein